MFAVVPIVFPVMMREVHSFAEAVPGYAAKIRGAIVPWLERTFNLAVPTSLGELADKFGARTVLQGAILIFTVSSIACTFTV